MLRCAEVELVLSCLVLSRPAPAPKEKLQFLFDSQMVCIYAKEGRKERMKE